MRSRGRALQSLRRVVGEEALREHEPLVMEGVELEATLRPESAQALADALGVLAEEEMALLVRGGGDRLAIANPLTRADLLLDTTGLAAEPVIEAEEGVAWVQAGTPVALLRERAREAGWDVALDPPGSGATVGGSLAAAAVGPRSPHPRDVVLGMEVALASGRLARCGGRVVKNVTGYDLAKLYVGSFGSLAVISSAWLRLRPPAQAEDVLEAELPADSDRACALALAAARRPTARVCALVDASLWEVAGSPGTPAARRLVVELAGDAPAVAADRKALGEIVGATSGAPARVESLRALQGRAPEAGLRLRVSCLAAALPGAAAILGDAGARLLVHPGKGLLYAFFEDAGSVADLARAFEAARRAARAGQGALLLEAAPLALRASVDVFDPPEPWLRLFHALKQQYDPKGVLNPGRFAGGL